MAIAAGFSNSVLDAQKAFRTVMQAIARPGRVLALEGVATAPAPLFPTAAAIALALSDYDTPVCLDALLAAAPDVAAWLRFHTGAPIVDERGRSTFAFLADPAAAPGFADFALGEPEYPDRSTTLVLQVERFAGTEMRLRGPGIKGSQAFSATPLPADFVRRMADNRALFPRGVDVLMVTRHEVAALPRSVRVADEG